MAVLSTPHAHSAIGYSMPFRSIWLAAISMTLMIKAIAKAQMRLFLTQVCRFFFLGWTEMRETEASYHKSFVPVMMVIHHSLDVLGNAIYWRELDEKSNITNVCRWSSKGLYKELPWAQGNEMVWAKEIFVSNLANRQLQSMFIWLTKLWILGLVTNLLPGKVWVHLREALKCNGLAMGLWPNWLCPLMVTQIICQSHKYQEKRILA